MQSSTYMHSHTQTCWLLIYTDKSKLNYICIKHRIPYIGNTLPFNFIFHFNQFQIKLHSSYKVSFNIQHVEIKMAEVSFFYCQIFLQVWLCVMCMCSVFLVVQSIKYKDQTTEHQPPITWQVAKAMLIHLLENHLRKNRT